MVGMAQCLSGEWGSTKATFVAQWGSRERWVLELRWLHPCNSVLIAIYTMVLFTFKVSPLNLHEPSRNSLMDRPIGLSCRWFWMLSSWKSVLTIIIPYIVSFRLYVYQVKHTSSHLVCSYHQTYKYDDEVSEAELERISSITLWVLIAMRTHRYQKKLGKERAYFFL